MSMKLGSDDARGRAALMCGATTAGVGTLSFAGWATGWGELTGLRSDYIPMAPNTALLFALLGGALLAGAARPASTVIRRCAAAVALFSLILAGVTLISLAAGHDLGIDEWLFRATQPRDQVPVGHMSPVSAFCFVLASVALWLLGRDAKTPAAVLGTLIALIGAVNAMGYWYGAPLLYGGSVIPVALPTALVFTTLGAGLIAAAGTDSWPLRTLTGPSTRAHLLRRLLPVVIFLALIQDWISVALIGQADSKVVLAFAVMAVLFLLAISMAVSQVSRVAGDSIDLAKAERERAERILMRQKDLYHALSETNHAIVRLTNREELFQTVCRIAVEHGRLRFVWIGLIDKDDQRLMPVARYGEDNGFIDALDVLRSAANDTRRGLTGRTLLSGACVISNDFLDDPAMAPWHEAGRRAGVQAAAKFPIRQGGTVVGAISFYAGEPGFFSDEMLALLDEMALDVSFALDNFARDAGRRRADEALRESEQELRTIFEGALDGMLVADAETKKIIKANAAICSMLGYAHEEIVRIGMPDIHPKQDLPRVNEQFEGQRRGEIRIAADTPMLRKDGSVFYAAIKAAPIRLGGKDCLLGIFRDITERKRAEEGLRAAEEQFRGLVEQSFAGIYIIQDGKLAYVNPRGAEILGQASWRELIGTDPLQRVVEADRGKAAENLRRLLDGEVQRIAMEFRLLRQDGTTIQVGANIARATHQGRPAIIGLLQDISEKKRAEGEIQRYVEQLKTAFMSTVEVATTLSEMRDPYTAGHERRVAEIAVVIGAELGFDASRLEGLQVAGHLHDIGKITVPTEILAKPGKLSAIEFQLIQGHAQASYDVLKAVEWPWPVAQVALQHHERMDGSGYPQGLKGEAILLEARILAVADVIEAMSSHRPYRPGLGIETALAEIERGCGTIYDTNVADACLRLFRDKHYPLPA